MLLSASLQVRGTAIGIWSSCENLGGVFANNVAAKALASYGWRSAFFVSGPLVAIWSVVLWAVLPADSTATSVSKKEKGKAKSDAPATSALSIPGVAATAGAYTLTKCARYCLMVWLPYFLSKAPEGPHFSPAAAGSIASLLDLAGTIGAIATGVACDRLYGGATLRAASHLCAATGFSFCVWAVACLYGANANVHVMVSHLPSLPCVLYMPMCPTLSSQLLYDAAASACEHILPWRTRHNKDLSEWLCPLTS